MGKLAALLIGLLAATALAISLDTSTLFTFTDCASGGSAAQTVTGGRWLVTVNDEATWVCITDSASTCASGGTKLPSGMAFLLDVNANGKSISCRSSGSTGDLQFSRSPP
jgi:hypothetical protein